MLDRGVALWKVGQSASRASTAHQFLTAAGIVPPMSIVKMMTPASRTGPGGRAVRPRRGAPRTAEESAGAPSGVLSQLTDYIPSEAVAL